jgi:predicted ArsR family transcriptional regulator
MLKSTKNTTRQAVIEALKATGQATVSQISQMVGVKAITVRHHLNVLLAEGLIEQQEKRQTIGRPIHVYCLSERAESLFPHQYHRLVERLLDQVKEKLPPETIQMLMNSLASSLVGDLRRELEQVPVEARMSRLVALLAQEGFLAEWERSEKGLRLIEYHCPYYFIGQRYPEICQIDETLIRLAMGAEVAKETCLLAGDSACEFVLRERQSAVSSEAS